MQNGKLQIITFNEYGDGTSAAKAFETDQLVIEKNGSIDHEWCGYRTKHRGHQETNG